ncbi:MAG: hypothetical protein R3C19_12690 [Planctomycetaceae bacterium]
MFLCTASNAVAKPPVGLKIEPLSIRGRSGGPIGLQIKLDYSQSLLMEGDLLLRVYHGTPNSNRRPSEDDLICTLRYDGIVLQGTDYFFRTILPPIEHAFSEQYEIEAWFETDSQRIPLSSDVRQLDPPEPHDLLSIGAFERAAVLCSCSGQLEPLRLSPARRFLNDALSLDNYNPLPSLRNDGDGGNRSVGERSRRVQCFSALWDARDLPEDPLALCSFDVVLLSDGSVGRLQPAQMEALKTWIQAGGSLCVLPGEDRMDGRHLTFLQELFESENDPGIALSLTDDGELLVISDDAAPIVLRYVGLGRVALLPDTDDLSQRLAEPELGRLVAHLWKARQDSRISDGQKWTVQRLDEILRANNVQAIQQQDKFFLVPIGANFSGNLNYNNFRQFDSMEALAAYFSASDELFPVKNLLVDACSEALMPSGVKMVPTWVIAAILTAYVVTIGPVDYLVLGFFRLRKLTWMLFPVVTLFYTLLTVSIANAYMASADTGGRLVITDLVDDGRAVRETAVQLHFHGSRQTVATPETAAFVVPTTALVNQQSANAVYGPNPAQSRTTSQSPTVLNYSGRFPQSYAAEQTFQQWTPKMTRTLTLTPDAQTVPRISWNDASLVSTSEGRAKLAGILSEASIPGGTLLGAAVLHQGQVFEIEGHAGPFQSQVVSAARQRLVQSDQYVYYNQELPDEHYLAAGLVDATSCTQAEFFSVVSQVSPHGSGTLEDLPIQDASDPGQWVLMILVKTDQGYHAYRKLYVAEE